MKNSNIYVENCKKFSTPEAYLQDRKQSCKVLCTVIVSNSNIKTCLNSYCKYFTDFGGSRE